MPVSPFHELRALRRQRSSFQEIVVGSSFTPRIATSLAVVRESLHLWMARDHAVRIQLRRGRAVKMPCG